MVKLKFMCPKIKKSFKRIPEVDRMEFEKYLGKVAFEFIVSEIAEFTTDYRQADTKQLDTILVNACLSFEEAVDYDNGKCLYALNINELKIYDNPKELGEFKHICKNYKALQNTKNEKSEYEYSLCCGCENICWDGTGEGTYYKSFYFCNCNGLIPVTKAPQNYMRIEEDTI